MSEYTGIAEATEDVRSKLQDSRFVTHPLLNPTLAVVVPQWTDALSGFQAKATVSPAEAMMLEQIMNLYDHSFAWLEETAEEFNLGTLNEHSPANVLFMGLFRDFQSRFADKQNLNPHKLAVLLAENYTVTQ